MLIFCRRIEGAPNFRRVPLALRLVSKPASSPGSEAQDGIDFVAACEGKWVCGRYVLVTGLSVISSSDAHLFTAVVCPQLTGKLELDLHKFHILTCIQPKEGAPTSKCTPGGP